MQSLSLITFVISAIVKVSLNLTLLQKCLIFPLMPAFTVANAKEMAAKSVIARKERAQKPAIPPLEPVQPADEYTSNRLACVRAQLAQVDAMIFREADAQKLDRLASAQMRLAEQERILAGRPLPGSLKPASPRSRRQAQSFDPIEPQT